jgi:hypothetical protein
LLAFTAEPLPIIDKMKNAAAQVLNVSGIFNNGNKVFNDHIRAIGIQIIIAITSTIIKATTSSFIYLIFYITFFKDQL